MVRCIGFYTQSDTRYQMSITSASKDASGDGRFDLEGDDVCGHFTLSGTIVNNVVKAVKHYPTYIVDYAGIYEVQQRKIMGNWSFPGGSHGYFELIFLDQ